MNETHTANILLSLLYLNNSLVIRYFIIFPNNFQILSRMNLFFLMIHYINKYKLFKIIYIYKHIYII